MYIMRAQKTLPIVTLARRVLVTSHPSLSMLRVYIRGYLFITVPSVTTRQTANNNSSPTLKDMGPKRNKNYKKPTSVQIVRKVSSQMHCLKNTRMQTLARLHRKILNVIIAGHLGGLSATHPLLGT